MKTEVREIQTVTEIQNLNGRMGAFIHQQIRAGKEAEQIVLKLKEVFGVVICENAMRNHIAHEKRELERSRKGCSSSQCPSRVRIILSDGSPFVGFTGVPTPVDGNGNGQKYNGHRQKKHKPR